MLAWVFDERALVMDLIHDRVTLETSINNIAWTRTCHIVVVHQPISVGAVGET